MRQTHNNRLAKAIQAFFTILFNRDHVYADTCITSHAGGTVRVCGLIKDVHDELTDELLQDKLINNAKQIINENNRT